jgi:hypothetical protein
MPCACWLQNASWLQKSYILVACIQLVSILIVADVGPVIASVVVVAWRDAPWRRRDVARRDPTWRDVCNVHGVARHLSYCYY